MSEWFIGGYGADMRGSAPGIQRMTSLADGSLALDPGFQVPFVSPSFLVGRGSTVYAALEGENEIVALNRDTLAVIGRANTGGVWPCHIGIYGDTAVVANYFDGTLGVLNDDPLTLTHALGSEGSGPHAAQDGPHAHSSLEIEPGTIVSADLGADRLHLHRLADGRLERTASVALPAGTGPRDLALHASGLLYVLGEHSRAVLVLEWNGTELSLLATSAIPGAEATDQAAGLVISDEGLVYTLLRGTNRVGVLRSSADGRTLDGVGWVSSAGDWPRHLALDSAALVETTVLHVANQQSSTVASFALGVNGMPTLIGDPTPVPSPTYLLKV